MALEMNNIGRQIGNYRVITEIGSGGFARVYRGEHIFLKERAVAIKLLHTYLGSPEECDRFLQEALMLEKLKHQHILLIYDVGIDQGFPYLVAEYAPNGSLRDRIKRYAPHPLPAAEAVRILSQIGQALHFAHQQNIIHRDLKPENILFNREDQALLADFGIATTLTSTSFMNVKIIGTPSYMAPEQFQGSVCKESDQYALGCIGYELVTGYPPFSTDNVFATGFKHLKENPLAPTQLNPDLTVHIEEAILKAMAKERSNRYSNLLAFISALYGPTFAISPTFSIPPIYQPTMLRTELSTPHYSPAVASTTPQNASQEKGEEKIPPLSNEDKKGSKLLNTPSDQYQELFHFSDQDPVTLPSLLMREQFSVQSWTTGTSLKDIFQRGKRGNRRRWLILGIACIVIVASIFAGLLFAAFPDTSRGISSIVIETSTSSRGSQFSSPTAAAQQSGTPRLNRSKTPQAKLPGTPGSTSTATVTSSSMTPHASTPTARPTAKPTPKLHETLKVDFTNPNGTQTQYSYQGSVTLSMSGIGQASSNQLSDAFYRYTDTSGTPITTPGHPSCWVLWINNQAAEYSGQIPPYNGSTHTYTFSMNAPGGTINFKVCDQNYSDNSGSYTIMVTQN